MATEGRTTRTARDADLATGADDLVRRRAMVVVVLGKRG